MKECQIIMQKNITWIKKSKNIKFLFVDLLLKLIVLILEIQEFLNFTKLIKKYYFTYF